MKVAAVIAEFNPLHNGHAYLLQQARLLTGADYVLVLMSGNYVQRGEAALFDKDLRTRAALLCGADIVMELPLPFACSSAEYFAQAAVSLLNRLGCVTHLVFGSESGDLAALSRAAALLGDETADYQAALQKSLKDGRSFPAARLEALRSVSTADPAVLSELFASPNNILALEYLKALRKTGSAILPVTIAREGMGYHDTCAAPSGTFVSATYLRERLPAAFSDTAQNVPDADPGSVPQAVFPLYQEALSAGRFCLPETLSLPLQYALFDATADSLCRYQDVSPDLADKLIKYRDTTASRRELIAAVKSRDLTYTRISRALLHILLHLTAEEVAARKEDGYCGSAAVLGFRDSAAPFLTQCKKKTGIPLLTRYRQLADLDPLWHERAMQDLRADALYYRFQQKPAATNVYSRQIIRF